MGVNSMTINILEIIFQKISSPSLLLTITAIITSIILAIILDGVERKIRARIQCRMGPPILQTLYDLVKLSRKEAIVPHGASKFFTIAPKIALIMLIIDFLYVPYGFKNPLGFYGDIILFIYLLVASTIVLIYGGLSSGNPFSEIGCSREASLLMANELAIALIIATIAFKTGSLSLNAILESITLTPSILLTIIALAIYAYIESARLPFDIGEAEPEIATGYLIEYSGPLLSLALCCHIYKRYLLMILLSIPIYVLTKNIIPVKLNIVVEFSLFMTIVIALYMLYSVITSISGRFRVIHAVNFVRASLLLPIASLILATIGL